MSIVLVISFDNAGKKKRHLQVIGELYFMKHTALFIFFIFCYFVSNAQNLFLEKTFVGGVTVAGRTSFTFIDGYFKIRWEPDYQLVAAYALTYRYGRPTVKPFTINGSEFLWDSSNQIGAEQLDNDNIQYFATNVQEITDKVVFTNDSIYVTMNGADFIQQHPNQGWWSLDFVFLYTSPSISDTTTIRIYTASQPQTEPQSYSFHKPVYKPGTDVGFSIYSDRVGGPFGPAYEDRTCIGINGQSLGCIWSADQTNIGASGVRGHFYYENGNLTGLDDDTANTQVYKSDGIAIINGYLNDQPEQNLYLFPVNAENPQYGFNPHPAFFIVYTPDGCSLSNAEMPREYTTCCQQSNPRGQPDKAIAQFASPARL